MKKAMKKSIDIRRSSRKPKSFLEFHSLHSFVFAFLLFGMLPMNVKAQKRELYFAPKDSVYDVLSRKENYYPFKNKEKPYLSYKISFVIIQDSKRNLGMQNDGITRKSLQKSVKIMNEYYSNNARPIDTIIGRKYVKDVKLRARIANIYFIDDSSYYENKSLSALSKKVHEEFPETQESIIIVLNQFNYTGALGWANVLSGSGGWASYQPIVQTLLVNHIYIAGNEEEFAQHWLHEINHLFGLNHIYTKSSGTESCDPSKPDYLSDVFGEEKQSWCENPPSGCKVCYYTEADAIHTNNIMSGNNIKSPSKAAYFSPMQIARIHRHSTIQAIGYWLKSRGKADTRYIDRDTEIKFTLILRGDLVVEEGKTLIIQSKLYLDKKARIILEPNAKIIIDNGSIEPLGFGKRKLKSIKILGNKSDNRILLKNEGRIVRKVKKNGEVILQ